MKNCLQKQDLYWFGNSVLGDSWNAHWIPGDGVRGVKHRNTGSSEWWIKFYNLVDDFFSSYFTKPHKCSKLHSVCWNCDIFFFFLPASVEQDGFQCWDIWGGSLGKRLATQKSTMSKTPGAFIDSYQSLLKWNCNVWVSPFFPCTSCQQIHPWLVADFCWSQINLKA